MVWSSLTCFDPVQSDPVRGLSGYGLSGAWPVELGVYVLIWRVTHQGTICLIPGLSGTRPVKLWPVCLACPIAGRGGAATASVLRQRRCCDNVDGAGSASCVCGRVYLWKLARHAFVGAGAACVSLVDWFVVAGLAWKFVDAGRWSRRALGRLSVWCVYWLVHKF